MGLDGLVMATFVATKVLASLPDPLEANTAYFVRVGTGFDLYVADSTGQIAYKANAPAPVVPAKVVTAASYTLVAADAGQELQFPNGCAVLVDASVFSGGEYILLRRTGSTDVTIAAAAGTTQIPANVVAGAQGALMYVRIDSAALAYAGGEVAA